MPRPPRGRPQVLSANEMYDKVDRFFNDAFLAREAEDGASGRDAKRGGAGFPLAAKKAVFTAILTLLELFSGGQSKMADERRIHLLGVVCDEVRVPALRGPKNADSRGAWLSLFLGESNGEQEGAASGGKYKRTRGALPKPVGHSSRNCRPWGCRCATC